MKIERTAKGNVKIVLSEDQAEQLRTLLCVSHFTKEALPATTFAEMESFSCELNLHMFDSDINSRLW